MEIDQGLSPRTMSSLLATAIELVRIGDPVFTFNRESNANGTLVLAPNKH
jgi:hypothetical protein